MTYPARKALSLKAVLRGLRAVRARFPDTPVRRLPGKARALDRRRAKNRVAKASRKANRKFN